MPTEHKTTPPILRKIGELIRNSIVELETGWCMDLNPQDAKFVFGLFKSIEPCTLDFEIRELFPESFFSSDITYSGTKSVEEARALYPFRKKSAWDILLMELWAMFDVPDRPAFSISVIDDKLEMVIGNTQIEGKLDNE